MAVTSELQVTTDFKASKIQAHFSRILVVPASLSINSMCCLVLNKKPFTLPTRISVSKKYCVHPNS